MKHYCFYFAFDQIILELNIRFNQEINLVNLKPKKKDILYFKI